MMPWWVFALFGYFTFFGIYCMKKHTVSVYKLLIVFFALAYYLVHSQMRLNYDINQRLVFCAMFFASAVFGIGVVSRMKLLFDRDNNQIVIPGSIHMLLALWGIFGIKTLFGYLRAMQPIIAQEYILAEIVFSSVFSGFLMGRLVAILRRYYK